MEIHELKNYCARVANVPLRDETVSFVDLVSVLVQHGQNRPYASETMLRFMAEFLDEHAAILNLKTTGPGH